MWMSMSSGRGVLCDRGENRRGCGAAHFALGPQSIINQPAPQEAGMAERGNMVWSYKSVLSGRNDDNVALLRCWQLRCYTVAHIAWYHRLFINLSRVTYTYRM